MSKTEMEQAGPRRLSAAVSEASAGGPPPAGPTRRVSRMEHTAPGMLHISRKMSIMRRMSIASHRTDNSSSMRPPVKLQNTYRLGPAENEVFKSYKVRIPTLPELSHNCFEYPWATHESVRGHKPQVS